MLSGYRDNDLAEVLLRLKSLKSVVRDLEGLQAVYDRTDLVEANHTGDGLQERTAGDEDAANRCLRRAQEGRIESDVVASFSVLSRLTSGAYLHSRPPIFDNCYS